MKFIVMLRVKDGILFVDEWLTCFEKLVDEIVVLDNGSTDGTYEVLKAHPKVVDIVRTEGYNEGRDKNLLYSRVRMRKPDWCIWVDVDEIFEPGLTRAHFDRLMNSKIFNKFAFRRFHFIDRETFAGSWFRLNYSAGHDRMMWRESPTGYFENLVLDSPNVKGIKGLTGNTNFRLKHLGYISKDLVDKKAAIYRTITTEIESTLQEMYMRNERKIKWIDDRRDFRVVFLNHLLTLIRFGSIPARAIKKIGRMVNNRKAGNSTKNQNAAVLVEQKS
jgi:glycosyltransferase involved in cell wall biosynthesis